MDAVIAVGLLVGSAVLGAVIAWLLARPRVAADAAAATARLEEGAKRITRLEQEVAGARAQLEAAERNKAWLEADLQHERHAGAEKLAVIAEAERKLREAFQTLSAEALRQNNQSFLELARTQLGEFQQDARLDLTARHTAIDELLKPVRESLERLDQNVRRVETGHGALSEQVRSLYDSEQQLRTQTATLSLALRAPGVRGRWGEVQLRRVVELAGMLDYCDFEEQLTVDGDEGRLRPDLVVRLPGGRQLVVDAKAVTRAYVDAEGTTDDEQRRLLREEHARLVREHMTRLGAKAYWSQFPLAPEFVVMFLPGENFFRAALEVDGTLIDRGVELRVLLASPLNLIALLWGVAQAWREHQVAETAREVCDNGRELYKRIGKLAEHFETLRNALGRAVDAYNSAVGSLDRRVLPAARRFKELGASSGDDIPELGLVDVVPEAVQAPELLPLFDPSRDDRPSVAAEVPRLPIEPLD